MNKSDKSTSRQILEEYLKSLTIKNRNLSRMNPEQLSRSLYYEYDEKIKNDAALASEEIDDPLMRKYRLTAYDCPSGRVYDPVTKECRRCPPDTEYAEIEGEKRCLSDTEQLLLITKQVEEEDVAKAAAAQEFEKGIEEQKHQQDLEKEKEKNKRLMIVMGGVCGLLFLLIIGAVLYKVL
jgi:uncharacterized OB-fold protein